jgi:hypothetical protein
MSARTMTQLVEGQPARLDVGESLPCRVMRVTRDDVGVQFERNEDADRLLLASLALAYHRPR